MIVEVRRIYSNGYGDDYADFQPGTLMFEVGDKPAKYDSYYSCVCWERTTCVASTARARARALTESWHRHRRSWLLAGSRGLHTRGRGR
jgi:hypothetical protein